MKDLPKEGEVIYSANTGRLILVHGTPIMASFPTVAGTTIDGLRADVQVNISEFNNGWDRRPYELYTAPLSKKALELASQILPAADFSQRITPIKLLKRLSFDKDKLATAKNMIDSELIAARLIGEHFDEVHFYNL